MIDQQIGVGIVERNGGVGRKVFKQAQMLLGIGILFEALDAEHTEHTLLRNQGQINHRRWRLRNAAVFELAAGVLVDRRCTSSTPSQHR